MAVFRTEDGVDIHYRVDDFADPWSAHESVLFLHGNSESGAAWYSWVPHFGRQFRTIRPDMRGFGDSTPMPENYEWRIERLVDDNVALLEHLSVGRVHIVAAKIGSLIAFKMAAMYPQLLASLTVVGPPPSISAMVAGSPSLDTVRQQGVEGWARGNMAKRLGSSMPPEAVEWWSRYMGRTAASTQIGFLKHVAIFEIDDCLEHIRTPTAVIVADRSHMSSETAPDERQKKIPGSRLIVVPSDSYHIAVAHSDLCAGHALDFIRSVGG